MFNLGKCNTQIYYEPKIRKNAWVSQHQPPLTAPLWNPYRKCSPQIQRPAMEVERRTSLVIFLPVWKPYNHVFICVCTHTFFGGGGNLRQKHVSKISSMIFTINSFQRSSVSWVFKTAYRILVRILLLTAPPLQNRHCVDDFSVFYCWTHTVRHQPFLVLKTGWKWWWHTNFVPQGTKTNLKYGGEINV